MSSLLSRIKNKQINLCKVGFYQPTKDVANLDRQDRPARKSPAPQVHYESQSTRVFPLLEAGVAGSMWDWVSSTPRLCLDGKEVHSGFWTCFRTLRQQVSLPVRLCYSLLPHTMFFSPCNCVRELNSLVICLKEILGPWYGPDRFLGVTIWLHKWMVLSNGLEEGTRGKKVNIFLQNSKSHRDLPCSRATVITS